MKTTRNEMVETTDAAAVAKEAERVRQARYSVSAERRSEESRRNRAAGRAIRAWRKTV